MKNKIMFIFVSMFAFTSTVAFAISKPGWERPLYSAQMEKVSAQGHFELAQNVRLMMTQLDESETPTGLRLSYMNSMLEQFSETTGRIDLTIVETREIECGSVQYIARLLATQQVLNMREPADLQHRFTVVLTDHTRRVCKDYRPYAWEASVREGYGWCGTMDATMELRGNPKGIFTIQNAQ